METLERKISQTSQLIKLALSVGTGFGVLILIIYLAKVGYTPVSLSLGDSIFIFSAALSFGFVCSVLVFLTFCLSLLYVLLVRVILIRKAFKEILKSKFEVTNISFNFSKHFVEILFAIIGIIWLLNIYSIALNDALFSIAIFASVIFMGTSYLVLSSDYQNKSFNASSKSGLITIVIAIYIFPLVSGAYNNTLLDTSMTYVGIRSDSVIFKFKDGYKDFIDEVLKIESEKELYEGRVLVKGLGSMSLIEINSHRFEIPNDSYYSAKNN